MIGTLLLATALPLLPADSETEKLKDEIRFAEDLSRYAYFELATDVLDGLVDDVDRLSDDDLAGELLYVKARAAQSEADRALDAARRSAARERAIELYNDFSKDGSEFAFHDRLLDALENLAYLHQARADESSRLGRAGNAELLLDARDDYQAADEAFERFSDEAADIADQLDGDDKESAAQLMRDRGAYMLYARGLNGINWSRVSDDPAFRLEDAITNLDDFLWEVDEGKLAYLLANFEQARAYATLSEYTADADEAEEYMVYAREILTEGILSDLNFEFYWDQIGTGVFGAAGDAQVAALFDQAWAFLAELDATEGDLEAAQSRIDTMRAKHAEKEARFGPEGLRALLSWSEKLVELGRAAEATEILRFVASPDGGRGTPEGAEADAALKTLVASEGLGEIDSVDVLMSVSSEYARDGDAAEASFGYLRAAALVSTPEERSEFLYDAFMGAGDALRLQKFFLEAGIAYEQALDYLLADAPTDLVRIEQTAYRINAAYSSHYAETQDEADKALRTAKGERLQQIPGVELDVQWAKANEAYEEARATSDETERAQAFLAALAEFEAVPESSANYERAIVFAGRCLEGAGRFDDALARWAEMRARAQDASLNPTNPAGRSRREASLGLARYDAAALLLSDDLNRPDEALALLQDFEDDLPGQANLHNYAKFQRTVALARLGRLNEAEEALDVVVAEVGDQQLVYRAAYEVAVALESAALAAEAGSRRDLYGRAARAMGVYNEARDFASFDNGRSAGLWFLEAGEPAEAETVFRALIAAKDGKVNARLLDTARTGLARSLDRQQDYGRARPLWKELLARNPNDTGIKRGAALSYGGWLEVDDAGNVVEVAGSGDYADAATLWADLYVIAKSNHRYEEMWWECKVGAIYTAYRQIGEDSTKGREARAILENLKLPFPQYDRDVQERLDEDKRWEPRFHVLLRYLDRKVPTS